jgi:predicted O-methyltransferase YrrM
MPSWSVKGKYLADVVKHLAPGHEIGTLVGYSAILMAKFARCFGRYREVNPDSAALAQENIRKANLAQR